MNDTRKISWKVAEFCNNVVLAVIDVCLEKDKSSGGAARYKVAYVVGASVQAKKPLSETVTEVHPGIRPTAVGGRVGSIDA